MEQLASSTQMLTFEAEKLTPDNVTTAAQIANKLLNLSDATEVPKKTKNPVTESVNLQRVYIPMIS